MGGNVADQSKNAFAEACFYRYDAEVIAQAELRSLKKARLFLVRKSDSVVLAYSNDMRALVRCGRAMRGNSFRRTLDIQRR